jgi:hypothetical protein
MDESCRDMKSSPVMKEQREKQMAGRFPRFAALPFVAIDDDVVAGRPVRCINERAAIECAERLLTVFGNVGSIALRRSSVSSEQLDVLQTFGDVPVGSDLVRVP